MSFSNCNSMAKRMNINKVWWIVYVIGGKRRGFLWTLSSHAFPQAKGSKDWRCFHKLKGNNKLIWQLHGAWRVVLQNCGWLSETFCFAIWYHNVRHILGWNSSVGEKGVRWCRWDSGLCLYRRISTFSLFHSCFILSYLMGNVGTTILDISCYKTSVSHFYYYSRWDSLGTNHMHTEI